MWAAFFIAQTSNAFQSKQQVLDCKSAAVAAQGTAGPYDPMARNDNRDRVVVIGLAYSPERSWAAHLPGDIGIGAGPRLKSARQISNPDNIRHSIFIYLNYLLAIELGGSSLHIQSC